MGVSYCIETVCLILSSLRLNLCVCAVLTIISRTLGMPGCQCWVWLRVPLERLKSAEPLHCGLPLIHWHKHVGWTELGRSEVNTDLSGNSQVLLSESLKVALGKTWQVGFFLELSHVNLRSLGWPHTFLSAEEDCLQRGRVKPACRARQWCEGFLPLSPPKGRL